MLVVASAECLPHGSRLNTKPSGFIVVVAGSDEDMALQQASGLIDTTVQWPLLREDFSRIVAAMIDGRSLKASTELLSLNGDKPLKKNDLDQFARAAHALKSTSYNAGARGVADAASAFENAARLEDRIVSPVERERLAIQLMNTMAELDGNRAVGS
jgi:HPt (histidine-containing phosphotransfer) domain-containing protein